MDYRDDAKSFQLLSEILASEGVTKSETLELIFEGKLKVYAFISQATLYRHSFPREEIVEFEFSGGAFFEVYPRAAKTALLSGQPLQTNFLKTKEPINEYEDIDDIQGLRYEQIPQKYPVEKLYVDKLNLSFTGSDIGTIKTTENWQTVQISGLKTINLSPIQASIVKALFLIKNPMTNAQLNLKIGGQSFNFGEVFKANDKKRKILFVIFGSTNQRTYQLKKEIEVLRHVKINENENS